MTDQVVINSPFGPLAFRPDEIREASAKATEMAVALGLAAQPTSTPAPVGDSATWLSIEEVAQRTGLKKSWLYEQIRNDAIPFRQFGRQVRVPASYLAEPVRESGAKLNGGQK